MHSRRHHQSIMATRNGSTDSHRSSRKSSLLLFHRRSLGDKLQELAIKLPSAMAGLELVVDQILVELQKHAS